MENMRWILLLAGIVIILAIYVYGRWQSQRAAQPDRSNRQVIEETPGEIDPLFDEPQGSEVVDDALESLGQMIAEDRAPRENATVQPIAPASPEPALPDKVVTLFVLAPSGVPFRGTFLMEAMEEAGLQFGEMDIFHFRERHNGREQALFSVANVTEPGTFDPANMEKFTTRGLVLFLQLPAAFDATRAFDAMVESARSLAESLEGTVCDATRSVLTNQTIGHLREDVIDYQLRHRVAKTAS